MPRVVIVTPALADANNGNWQTARRWASMLRGHYPVRLAARWEAADGETDELMIALHARRSAASIGAWRAAFPGRPLLLVLTGTDLYRDIEHDAAARRSLDLADRLVVLQPLGLDALPSALHAKTRVCLQSTPARQTATKTTSHLRALMVGHLRAEKSPETYFAAARLLATRSDIRLDHIGGALDPALGQAAADTQAACPHYRWLGAMPHGPTREHIHRAHVLVHCSRIEGGAHVVIEAITSGTPVLASRIAGNLGLLGADYEGVFEWGDAAGLAHLLLHCRDEQAMLPRLQAQVARQAPLFTPERERDTLLGLVAELLENPR